MQISEAKKASGLTRKAIEYYIGQELLHPDISENGYRDFSADDIARLKKISVCRRLGLGTEEIRSVLADQTGTRLKELSVQKALLLREEQTKSALLDALSQSGDFARTAQKLDALEQNTAIAKRLLDTFPGYFGKLICLHFAAFFGEPAATADQDAAYREIVSFLDDFPAADFPKEVQEFLDEATVGLSAGKIHAVTEGMLECVSQPERFLDEHRDSLQQFFSVRLSEEYKTSPARKAADLLREFLESGGYYDTFLPAMERLSPSYAQYRQQIALADRVFRAEYPAEYAALSPEGEKT